MNITYISKYPSLDIGNWSGTEYFIAKSMEEQGANLNLICGLKDTLTLSVRIKSKLLGRPNRRYLIRRSPEFGKGYAKQILKRINPRTDIIFSPASDSIAYLNTTIPKVFYSDATFASMLGYYDWFDDICPQTIKEAMRTDQLALDTCKLAFYSSEWAARSAINDFNTDPEKVKVIPFGANIITEFTHNDIKKQIDKKETTPCQIIFLGVEWYRKGGDIVLEAVKILNNQLKLPTTLHIVGIDQLPESDIPSYVINHGRINKNSEEGLSRIERLISQSHFLFVPSRAEAYGLVFCEAMAFGVPCISTNTGGIPTIIKNKENGFLLDKMDLPQDYANTIYDAFTNKTLYRQISLAAYEDYNLRLNWDSAGKTIMKYLKEI